MGMRYPQTSSVILAQYMLEYDTGQNKFWRCPLRSRIYIFILVLSAIATHSESRGITRQTRGDNSGAVSQKTRDPAGRLHKQDTADSEILPMVFNVCQNYPNPFKANTVVEFDLPEESGVYAMIYNILGSRIRILENDIKGAGSYELEWDGQNDKGDTVSSGVYFLVLLADSNYSIMKMMFVK